VVYSLPIPDIPGCMGSLPFTELWQFQSYNIMDKLTKILNPVSDYPEAVQAPEISAWDDLLAILYSCQDLEHFPSVSLNIALSLTSASAGSFFLWDESQKEFILKAARGPYRERAHNAHVKLREGVLGWVGVQGASVLVKDIHADHRFQSVKRVGHYKSYSFISVPLLINHKLLGVINITERTSLEPFREEDHKLIQSLATHMANAYSRLKYQAQLHAENKQLHESLSKMKQEQKGNENYIQLGKLAANLTHELNNPMDAIRRYVNLALDKAAEDSLTREYLGKAKKGIRRAIRIIRSLLELAASSQTEGKLVEIHEIIHHSLETLEEPSFENIQIKKNFCDAPSYLRDPGLSIVLYNLYRNARQAMNGAGVLTITTYRSEHSLSVIVEDTGGGVNPAVRGRIFDTFFSTKNQGDGTGIGLALCRDIVHRCGGTIRCDENSQTGARFVMTLPCQNKGGN
jgi:signal transduction histidine kinase